MQIPLRWGKNADHNIHIRHETPKPRSLDERASWAFPRDRWWHGGQPIKRSQRQRRRAVRRGII